MKNNNTQTSNGVKTVFVGLSGGVDSGLSAYLLKEAGYNVVGVFLKVWEPDFLPCTAGQDRLDAMRVAAHLQIPFKTYDLEEEYKKSVVDHFIGEYQQGRTPNPDVMCNRVIKFGAFWDRAKKDGADCIATGHYCRVREGHTGKFLSMSEQAMTASPAYARNQKVNGAHALFPGVDESKDQSYFLWTLTQADLEHTLFPIGELEKTEVRKRAEKAGLPNAAKKDSQGLCFLGHVDMHEFLKHYIPVEKGEVKTTEGEVVGEHDGIWFYTIDQRISVVAGDKLYVVSKDRQNNTLFVSNETEKQKQGSREYSLSSVHWIRKEPSKDVSYYAQMRYHGDKLPVVISGSQVNFATPVLIAEGQSLVVYDSMSGECMGGGIIEHNADRKG